jgi:hypothetical protein
MASFRAKKHDETTSRRDGDVCSNVSSFFVLRRLFYCLKIIFWPKPLSLKQTHIQYTLSQLRTTAYYIAIFSPKTSHLGGISRGLQFSFSTILKKVFRLKCLNTRK